MSPHGPFIEEPIEGAFLDACNAHVLLNPMVSATRVVSASASTVRQHMATYEAGTGGGRLAQRQGNSIMPRNIKVQTR